MEMQLSSSSTGAGGHPLSTDRGSGVRRSPDLMLLAEGWPEGRPTAGTGQGPSARPLRLKLREQARRREDLTGDSSDVACQLLDLTVLSIRLAAVRPEESVSTAPAMSAKTASAKRVDFGRQWVAR